MPSFAPRIGTEKKADQLAQRELELHFALKNNISLEKVIKIVENYRTSQLSLLKATIHYIKEKEYQKKPVNITISSIEDKIKVWKNKTIEEIIEGFRTKNS